MGICDVDPSGYTQEDVRRLIVGSERANQMKQEIGFVFKFFATNSYSIPIGKSGELFRIGFCADGSEYALVFCRDDHNGELSAEIIRIADGRVVLNPTLWWRVNTDGLGLSFVKPIHDALPQILEVAARMYPTVRARLDQISSFADS